MSGFLQTQLINFSRMLLSHRIIAVLHVQDGLILSAYIKVVLLMILVTIDLRILVVSVLAKVLKKIVSTQFTSYLEENQLLHPCKSAFHCGMSTDDIL